MVIGILGMKFVGIEKFFGNLFFGLICKLNSKKLIKKKFVFSGSFKDTWFFFFFSFLGVFLSRVLLEIKTSLLRFWKIKGISLSFCAWKEWIFHAEEAYLAEKNCIIAVFVAWRGYFPPQEVKLEDGAIGCETVHIYI